MTLKDYWNKNKKLLSGLLAFYPLILLIATIFNFEFLINYGNQDLLEYLTIVLFLLIYMPVIYYIGQVMSWKQLHKFAVWREIGWNNYLWFLSFIMFGFITMPIYWYKYIWKK